MATNLNVAEIKRKAEAGIPLTNPTPEAMALYNQYKSASGSSSSKSSTSSSSNLNVAEIQRKAQLGIPLTNPTPEATALYNQYRSQSAGSTGASATNPQSTNKTFAQTTQPSGQTLPSGAVMYGGYQYGTDPVKDRALEQNIQTWRSDPAAKEAEIQRTLNVIRDLQSQGQDYSAQLKHLRTTLGYTGDIDTPVQGQEPQLPDYSWIVEMVNNELAQQRQAVEQELARLQQANQLAVQQNNQWLQEQIANLERNRIQAGEAIQQFQNRRGGFYSGGLDYQLGTTNRAFAEAAEGITRDIAARNADIWNRNALLAQQAAEKLSLLEQQVPARIQQLIQEQMERDRQFALQEAGVTGYYRGQPTLALQNQQFSQNLAQQQFDFNRAVTLAQLTGFLPDGTPTNAYQQQVLENEWRVAENTGRITPYLARLYGIPEGTPTLQAKQLAIQQQQANTAWYNAQTARMQEERLSQPPAQTTDPNQIQAQIVNGLMSFNDKETARQWLNANAAYITANLGSRALDEFYKMLDTFFQDTSQSQSRLRQQAVEAAMKDPRWLDPNQNKESLIQEYMRYLGG